MSSRVSHLSIACLASAIFLVTSQKSPAAYPGNSNFRNVGVINTATTRTDWVTNVTWIITQSTNPGYAEPVDWDTYSRPLAPGVDHIPTVLTKEGGWPTNMVCHMLRINLTTPGLRFTGTDRCPEDWGGDMPEDISKKSDGTYYKKRTVRERTSDFLARNRGAKSLGGKERDARIAFNLAAWLPWTTPYTNLWAEPYSPLYSDGASVSFTEIGGVANAKGDTVPQSMIVIYKDGTAELINSITAEKAKKIWFCAPAFVAEIVSAGQVPGHAMQIDPRTAMGISQDKKTLYLFFCDGRINGWSGGCYWSSLSTLLQAMGSWYAINLDGGGSSTFCVWDESSGKPMVFNRPAGGLRDNGSNAAIYSKMPDAMLGTWLYDDFDFLMQDIIDGETPDGVGEINVLGDATFTAEHPYVPNGRWTLFSTNNASIAWANGVTPQVAANTIVRFRDIRFREGSRTLSVAAGATAVFYDGVDLDEIDIQNAGGLVLAGVPACPVRVSCATVTGRNQTFATSTLSLADATVAAAKLVSDLDEGFVAVASGSDGNVTLSWDKLISLGDTSGSMMTVSRAKIAVTVAEVASGALLDGARLQVTVMSEDGRRSTVQSVALDGPGSYVFDTAQSSVPAVCASGYAYDYIVEITDASGVRIPHTETARGTVTLGIDRPWFAVVAADDSEIGGLWATKPPISDGVFEILEDSDTACFVASEAQTERVRLTTVATFEGTYDASSSARILSEIVAKETLPHGALLLAEDGDDLIWYGLVRENNAPAFRALTGPAVLGSPVTLVQEVDWSSGAPLVSYLTSTNGTDFARLVDAGGNSWFDSASAAASAAGRVELSGVGRVESLVGTIRKRSLTGSLFKIR